MSDDETVKSSKSLQASSPTPLTLDAGFKPQHNPMNDVMKISVMMPGSSAAVDGIDIGQMESDLESYASDESKKNVKKILTHIDEEGRRILLMEIINEIFRRIHFIGRFIGNSVFIEN